eukprot:1152706-Pelagomonas_calceolata.AAC.4
MTVGAGHSPGTVAVLALVHEDGLVRAAKVFSKRETLGQLQAQTQKRWSNEKARHEAWFVMLAVPVIYTDEHSRHCALRAAS